MKVLVRELMTADPVTVTPETGFKEMVALMERGRISGLPVVDGDGRVVGVVSEADLLLKEGHADLEPRSLFESRRQRGERAKARGEVARDLMTSPAITVTGAARVEDAARLMHARGVKRLPVVDEDARLVGILSRGDVLKVFTRGDEEIRRDVVDDVIVRTLWLDPKTIVVAVHDGIVELSGEVGRRSDVVALVALVTELSGVVGVRASGLTYSFDDAERAFAHS